MIKLISPKYLGNKTTDKVKKRCVELLYSWSEGLPEKTKIREAYDMLKRQGLVQSDPTYVEKVNINFNEKSFKIKTFKKNVFCSS
jgi:ADP-ribosylation factor-binding protein GGA